jgi:HK97 family phage prohead protease
MGVTMETKHLAVTIEKAASSEYDARFVMSATSPDRVKDTIDESAYKSNIGKKIIALWQHNSDQPFGYWHNLRVESGKLIGDLKAAGTNLGEMIKILIRDGVPLGASIGFRGKGEDNKLGGTHFKQIDILECSIVSVPAHPLAYQIAKSFGIEIDAAPDGQGDKPVEELTAVKQRAAAALQTSLKSLLKEQSNETI